MVSSGQRLRLRSPVTCSQPAFVLPISHSSGSTPSSLEVFHFQFGFFKALPSNGSPRESAASAAMVPKSIAVLISTKIAICFMSSVSLRAFKARLRENGWQHRCRQPTGKMAGDIGAANLRENGWRQKSRQPADVPQISSVSVRPT